VVNECSKEEQLYHFHDELETEYLFVMVKDKELFNLQRLSILAEKG
jgi:hypothetical protein